MFNLTYDQFPFIIFFLILKELNDLLNIDNPYFEGMINQIYPPELQLNKANIHIGFFKKKPMKRSAAVCFKRFPFALDFSVVDSLVRH